MMSVSMFAGAITAVVTPVPAVSFARPRSSPSTPALEAA